MPGSPSYDGVARRCLGNLYFVGPFWYWFQHWAMRRLPEWLKVPMTALWTSLFFLCLCRVRHGIARNLEVVLGPCGVLERQRRIFAVMHAWAWCRNERYERLKDDPKPLQLEIQGGEYFKQLVAEGRGFLVLTPHIGNYESGTMLPIELLEGRKLHLVRRAEPDPAAETWVRRLIARYTSPQIVFHTIAEQHDTGVALLHALREGDLVSMGCDRPPPGVRNMVATVCGRPFQLPSAPLRLMRAAEAPAVVMCLFREGRARYRLVVRPPIRVVDGNLVAAAAQLGCDLEWAIRERPLQWFTFGEVWPALGSNATAPLH